MSKVNLKSNIWIEGFDTSDECFLPVAKFYPDKLDNVLYEGKTSEIPEELAKECVYGKVYTFSGVKDYPDFVDSSNRFNQAKKSIQSACKEEYCVIYKIQEHEK